MLLLINGGEYTLTYNILGTANYILFAVGHWKFVFQFFVGAIDTKNMLWESNEWHIGQIIHNKKLYDWVVTIIIILSFFACYLNY